MLKINKHYLYQRNWERVNSFYKFRIKNVRISSMTEKRVKLAATVACFNSSRVLARSHYTHSIADSLPQKS